MTTQNASLTQTTANNYDRRTFLQAMIGAPLALGAMALLPDEAEAAGKTSTIKIGYVNLVVPRLWKSKLRGEGMGHSSGIYNYHLSQKSTYTEVLMVTMGNYRPGQASGKLKIKYRGSLDWTVSRGKVSCYVMATNVPLTVWESAHGQGTRLTKAQATELLKLSTGGKIKYDSLVNWSKATAKTKGAKAVRAWLGSQVVKKIRLK